MQTREIPREQWPKFLDSLSKKEADHPVRIEVEGGDAGGSQHVGESLKLIRIGVETKGSESGSLEVAVESSEGLLEHKIDRPQHLYVEEDDSGELACIDIEDAENVKTLIQFEQSASA